MLRKAKLRYNQYLRLKIAALDKAEERKVCLACLLEPGDLSSKFNM
jgi:hypothetical protein